MATNYNTVTVTNAATLILNANGGRRMFVIYNNGGSTIYVGPDTAIATGNAIPILAQGNFQMNGMHMWKGAVYGIATSGNQDTRYWEYIE